jgi:hypothetical protein
LPPEAHERGAKLVETADEAYQARFLPPEERAVDRPTPGEPGTFFGRPMISPVFFAPAVDRR